MNRHLLITICAGFFLSACVQAHVFKGEDYAYIKSNYPIISVNGERIGPAYTLDIKAGENILVIVYHTYRHEYACTFRWRAEAGITYEVTDQDRKYPLTLFRWEPTNRFWASRLDPVEPVQCTQKETQ